MKKTLKKNFIFFKNIVVPKNNKEANYYEQMFTKNESWNTPEPNEEEVLRWEIIKQFLKFIKNSKYKESKEINILDLGCGRGWLSNLLSDYGLVTGIEPVKAVVEYAKKIFPEINFLCGTSKDLVKNRRHEKYDLIVTSEVIEHIPDNNKQEFIDDIYKLLNDEGFLIITTPRKDAQQEWNTYMEPGQPIEDWVSESELEKLVTNRSFIKHKLERFAIPPIKDAPKIEIYQLWLFQKI